MILTDSVIILVVVVVTGLFSYISIVCSGSVTCNGFLPPKANIQNAFPRIFGN